MNNTLDERDRAVLEHLDGGDGDIEALAENVTKSSESVRERLSRLAENGLVKRVDDGRYALTSNRERVIAA